MKRTLKFLHEVGTVGVMGAVAAQIVLASIGPNLPAAEHAVLRQGILALARWLLLPSLGLVLLSGVFAMAVHKPFHNADWAWVKALMTPLVLEGTFIAVEGPARAAAKLSKRVAEGDEAAEAALANTLGHEWWGLWIVMLLFAAQIVLAVYRPRLRPRVEAATARSTQTKAEAQEDASSPSQAA